MNIIITVKEDYLPAHSSSDTMRTLFGLTECHETNGFFIFSREGIDDKVYIVTALSAGNQKYENVRMRDILKQLNLQSVDNCYFIFHDKDIRNRYRDYNEHYNSTFCKKEYSLIIEKKDGMDVYTPAPFNPGSSKTFRYWIFQHTNEDEIYQTLTKNDLDFDSLVTILKSLIEH